MTAISIRHFSGEIPKVAPELLPEGAAVFANNCNFNLGVLGGLRKGFDIWSGNHPNMDNSIRGLYTYDGAHWYTWTTPVQAYKGPVVDDSFQRIYYLQAGALYAAYVPEFYDENYAHGGTPPDRVLVGVPNPTVAPKLTLIERTTLADYPQAQMSFKQWWTDGVNQWGTVVLIPIRQNDNSEFRRYYFPPPAQSSEVPEGVTAILVVEATLTDIATGTVLFRLNSADNTSLPATSQALPGGVEMILELSSTNNFIIFSWGVTDTRAYVYTITNVWNEESGPSPAALISPTYMQDVLVETSLLDAWFVGAGAGIGERYLAYKGADGTTIYRTFGTQAYLKTAAKVQGTSYTSANPTFLDSARVITNVGTALISLDWRLPPTWVEGFVALPNGWFAVFRDNVLYMSEPYRPHTWQYSMTFPTKITGICAGPQALVVATTSSVYNVLGPHPASVNQVELDVAVGGISQEGMVRIAGGVAVVTNDGILVVQGSTASLEMSQQFWTREVWQKKYHDYLGTMMLGFHDGCLVAASWFNPIGFMLRMDETAGALTEFNPISPDTAPQITVLIRLPRFDALYYATWDGNFHNTRIMQFAASDITTIASWASKENIFPAYVKFGAGFVRMTGGGTEDILLDLWAEGQFLHQTKLSSSKGETYFRLPAHRGARRWQIQLQVGNNATVRELYLAQDMGELQSV